MVEKATGLDADHVFLDMEDSVAVADRGEPARAAARQALALGYRAPTVGMRINPVGSPWCLGDLIEIVGRVPRLDVVLVPKIETAGEVAYICHLLDALEREHGLEPGEIGVEILIETAEAMSTLPTLAATAPARVEALVFGPGDYAASIGAPQTMVGELPQDGPDTQAMALYHMVVAARATGMQTIDGPYGVINDQEGLERASRRARAVGCDGKWSIHPSQIDTLNAVFAASEEEVARARRILAALDGVGVARIGEEMVDEATRRLAEAILRRAGE